MNENVQSILIIFPEGNVANNPNMSSLVFLLYNIYHIYIVHERENQEFFNDKLHMCYIENICDNKYFVSNKELMENNFNRNNFSLIIGVDKGILFANYIASRDNTPLAFISYEINVNNCTILCDNQDIIACKDITFAICQDSMRAHILSRENKIPLEKIVNIPISEASNGSFKHSTYLHEKLQIPLNKKIALYIGSIVNWAMSEELINSAKSWSEEWVLVLHPRYGIDSNVLSLNEKINNNPNIYLSLETKTYTYELEEIICSANLGIVLYDFDFNSPYLGENLLYIGLSSGKFSIFMKYNIPVIVNNNTNIADIVFQNNLGYVVSDLKDIYLYLLSYDKSNFNNNCNDFFIKYLDFNLYKNTILSIIEKTIMKEDIVEIIKSNNQIINVKNIYNMRMEIIYNRMMTVINDLDLLYKNTFLRNKIKKLLHSLHLLKPLRKLKKLLKSKL